MNDSIIKKDSGVSGKTLAVFCGTHGNEKVGVFAVDKILKDIEVKTGVVYFVYSNPEAIKQDERFIEKNLNRCFLEKQEGNTYEEKRARELMKILDKCDALLDVHASNSPETIPFVITDNGLEIARNFDFEIIATGFDGIEPGATDGYMKAHGKVGICIECGYSGEGERNVDLAYNSIMQFLQYYDCVAHIVPMSDCKQKFLHVDEVQKVTPDHFETVRLFSDFETIPAGTLIARDDTQEYRIKQERVVLFGIPGKPIGAEAYILGSWIK